MADGCECHARGIGFAVGAVACDVGSGDECSAQEFCANVWFLLPGVNDSVAHEPFVHCVQQCAFVNNASARGVDDDGLMLKSVHERFICHVEGGCRSIGGQGRVEGDDVGQILDLSQRTPAAVVVGVERKGLAQRVAEQQLTSSLSYEGFESLPYSGSDMSDAYDAYRAAGEAEASVVL